MSQIEFKELTLENLPDVLEIYTYYILKSTATFHMNPLSLEEMHNLVFFENPKYRTFIILYNSTLCGYVFISRHKPREAYDGTAEVSVYLKPEYTGKRIGGEAIRFIERFARGYDIHVLIATITGGNNPSTKVFEKNGFIKCAHYIEVGRKFGQFLDIVAYQKVIN
ncbi:MAG: N-acetyltransferase family protein [Eubacteriales bacterium]